MSDLIIGTSGWSYNEWNGVFYPDPKTPKLTFYSKIFPTAEIDSTFYAYPSVGLVHGWARNTPDRFIFSAKLPRLITHDKRLDLEAGVEADLVRFLGLMKPLIVAGKLGPLLIQLPPSFIYKADGPALGKFLSIVPEDLKFAVEFRHPSWLRAEVWTMLKERNVANVIVDEPLLPPDTVTTADFSFIRWHGRGTRPWYNYRYKEPELKAWIPKVKEVQSKVTTTYGYFNNHFRGFAVENSLMMLKLLGRSSEAQDEAGAKASRFIESGPPKGEKDGNESMLEFVGEEK